MRLIPSGIIPWCLSVGFIEAQKQCERHVELMILQDASTSFYPMSKTMATNMGLLIDRITEKIGSVNASVALFSDKPTPFRGNGLGRGFKGTLDLCYYNDATYPLGTDADRLQEGYEAIKQQKCEGGDYPENPFEAMIYAAQDPKVQWSPASKNYTENDQRIVKIIVTVTDDHPHYAGDALSGINKWNPLSGDEESDGYPRFYERDFIELNAIYGDTEGKNVDRYLKLVELHNKTKISSEEQKEIDDLLDILGPARFDAPQAHPGTFDVYPKCQNYEYPKLELVGDILNKEKILPIVLLSKQSYNQNGVRLCKARGFDKLENEDDWLKCLLAVYRSDFKQSGVNAFMVEPYGDEVDDLMDQIVTLVDQLSYDVSCSDGANVVPLINPTGAPGAGGGAAHGHGGSTTTTAAAAGGAVAGVAALGGLLYKQFGASLLGHTTPGDLSIIEQVDVPDTPIEREAFEEVTMDMFQ